LASLQLYILSMLCNDSGPAAGEEVEAIKLGWSCSIGRKAGTMSNTGEQSTEWAVCARELLTSCDNWNDIMRAATGWQDVIVASETWCALVTVTAFLGPFHIGN